MIHLRAAQLPKQNANQKGYKYMIKLIQLSIVIALLLVFSQELIGGSVATTDKVLSSQGTAYVTANTSVQNIQTLICLTTNSVNCVRPNVGWNS